VIGAILRDLTRRLDYSHYRVFVGVYLNDPATAAAIAAVGDPRTTTVGCSRPGPTTKADCLNHPWRAVLAAEIVARQRYKAIFCMMPRDVVHPRELAIFAHLIPRLAMVQLPVAPLVDRSSRWVSGHYLDKFAEAHAKDMVIREAIGAAVPSAGVACAIDGDVSAALAGDGGRPFDPACMTEDYELCRSQDKATYAVYILMLSSGQNTPFISALAVELAGYNSNG
jgi:adsorption protein B